jgi:hypothetical protein
LIIFERRCVRAPAVVDETYVSVPRPVSLVVMSLALAGAALAAPLSFRADPRTCEISSVCEPSLENRNRRTPPSTRALGCTLARAPELPSTRGSRRGPELLVEEVYDGRAEALIAGVNPRGGVGAALARAVGLAPGPCFRAAITSKATVPSRNPTDRDPRLAN